MTLQVPRRFNRTSGRPTNRNCVKDGRSVYKLEDECSAGFHVWEALSTEDTPCVCGRKILSNAPRGIFIKVRRIL